MPGPLPPFPVSHSWEEFVGRWRHALEDMSEHTSVQEMAKILGGAILDLGWQSHVNRHAIRNFETGLLAASEGVEEIQRQVLGMTSILDGQRHGGAFDLLEQRIMARLDEQDRSRDVARRTRLWTIAGWVVAGVMGIAAAIVGGVVH